MITRSPTKFLKSEEQVAYFALTNPHKRATIDREITDHAIDFTKCKAKAKKPFFAYLPYTQTHEPVDAHPDLKGISKINAIFT